MSSTKSTPLSAAQRAAMYRRRRKEKGFSEVDKDNHRTRMKIYRENLKNNTKVWKDFRLRENERKRESRKAKRNMNRTLSEKDKQGYENVQNIEEIVEKIQSYLPKCLIERQAVIKSLAEANGFIVCVENDFQSQLLNIKTEEIET